MVLESFLAYKQAHDWRYFSRRLHLKIFQVWAADLRSIYHLSFQIFYALGWFLDELGRWKHFIGPMPENIKFARSNFFVEQAANFWRPWFQIWVAMSSILPEVFRIFLSPSRQMSGIVLQITPQPHIVMFAIYYSLIIILFDAVYPGLLTASKNNPKVHKCALYALGYLIGMRWTVSKIKTCNQTRVLHYSFIVHCMLYTNNT
jgi:hypothetical protein